MESVERKWWDVIMPFSLYISRAIFTYMYKENCAVYQYRGFIVVKGRGDCDERRMRDGYTENIPDKGR